jgi:ribonuclease HI
MASNSAFGAETNTDAEIYTDGSCHTQHRIGAWVAILLIGPEKKQVLSGTALDTTHNRMELEAVIRGIKWIRTHYPAITAIRLYTDSQYVTNLPLRGEKLAALDFTTRKGNVLANADLVKELLEQLTRPPVELVKIKAHQKSNGAVNYNTEADKLPRKLVREALYWLTNMP